MRDLIHQFVRPSRVARRLAGARRGSVLILCVVLIVVLALIGTAMLSGARIDRYATQQHGTNIQIEMLVEGARQIAQGVVVNDTVDAQSRRFRPAPDQAQLSPTSTYDHADGYYIPLASATAQPAASDAWLAVLVPELVGADVVWPAVSEPLTGGVFESPELGPGKPMTTRVQMVPASRNITYPDGTVQTFPAMRFVDPVDGVVTRTAADADGDGIADCMLSRLLPGEVNGVTWYVGWRAVDNAAKVNVNTAISRERDYDGTGAEITGVQFTKFFTGAIGLAEMLQDWNPTTANPLPFGQGTAVPDFARLNYRRFNVVNPGNPMPDGIVGGSGDPLADPVSPNPNPTARPDFDYGGVGEALYTAFGRRIGSPGWIRPTERWQPYSKLEMASLASRFTLLDPEASPTTLEEDLRNSVYDFAVNGANGNRAGMRRYAPNEAAEWYDRNFNFDPTAIAPIPNPAAFRPLRALLATHTPVSNWAPQHAMVYPPPGAPGGAPSTEIVPRGIRPAQKTNDPIANPLLMPDYDSVGTLTRSVAKANANTAKFGELWRAYWNVMTDHSTPIDYGPTFNGGTPFTSPAGFDLAQGMYFGNEFAPLTGEPVQADHAQHMYRSSLRDHQFPRNVYFPPYQQLLLRAAIAAANTEDLRDSNSDVNDDATTPQVNESDEQPTQRLIQLVAMVNGAATPVGVEVYGIEPQPYITEVYVNTQKDFSGTGGGMNPKGYVAIELYNPYPRPIDISGWVMAVIERRANPDMQPMPPAMPNPYPNPTGAAGLKGLSYFYIHEGIESTLVGTPQTAWPDPPYRFPAGATIPANGYLVLDNHSDGAAAPNANAANHYPMTAGAPANRRYVPNLHWVVQDENTGFKETRGGEFVLLRPVDTALPPALDPPGLENGNVMPIDSFDFTSLASEERWTQMGQPQHTSWHYVRSNAAAPIAGQTTNDAPNWKFVYPGRYYGAGDVLQQRHQGTAEQPWLPGSAIGDPQVGNPLLGEAGPAAVPGMTHTQHTIQLAGVGFPGPHAPTIAGPNRAPFGGFARNADLLQVTYVGAYRVFFAGDRSSTLELNSVTMDSCFANDTDADPNNPGNNNDELPTATAIDPDPATPWIDTREQVGRFVPLRISNYAVTPAVHQYNDLASVGTFDGGTLTPPGTSRWRYRWAIDLFDYLTVQAPGNDYFPDVPTDEGSPYTTGGLRQAIDNDGDARIGDVDVTAATATPERRPGAEDDVPVHGLININTAPAKVLAALPWLPLGDNWHWDAPTQRWLPGAGPAPSLEDNYELAKQIVLWRDGSAAVPANGPFTSPMDLYKVRAFWELQDELIRLTNATGGPDDADGDFSPHNTPLPPSTPPPVFTDAVRHDFEEQFLLLNKVSNLITTRSDSFTVYITVQGWSNVGKPPTPPQLVAQRRVAFIIDRSGIRVEGGAPKGDPVITPVPSD